MKRYLKLSPAEAIQFFVHHNPKLVSDTPEEVRKSVQGLLEIPGTLSVSITMPTHRIFPDTDKDIVSLKNLISETERALQEVTDKQTFKAIMENIAEAYQSVDYRHNLDGLVIYANENFSSLVRLPIELKSEILIDPYFDVRPLYKAIQQIKHYYILTVSRQKIRLIEAFNNRIIEEMHNSDFPFDNTEYYTTDPMKLMQDSFVDNLIKEFFNVADKRLQNYTKQNPLPLILMGDVKAVSYFREVMDNNRIVVAHVPGNYDLATTLEVVETAAPVISSYAETLNAGYVAGIDQGRSRNLLTTDIQEIYDMVNLGNITALYIGENYTLPGRIEDGKVRLANNNEDIFNTEELSLDIIEKIRNKGAKVIFMEDQLLEKYQGMVLIRQY